MKKQNKDNQQKQIKIEVPKSLTAWDLNAGTVTFTAANGDRVTFKISEYTRPTNDNQI